MKNPLLEDEKLSTAIVNKIASVIGDIDNKEQTKCLLSKWPVVLYRMKKSKRS